MNSWSAGVTSVELGRPDQVALVDLALDESRADHRDADASGSRLQRSASWTARAPRTSPSCRCLLRARDESGCGGGVDDVPASSCALILGTNVTTPLTTPPRLTPSTQSQSWYVASAMSLKRLMPAFKQRTWTFPRTLGLVRRACERLAVGHVELDRVHVTVELQPSRLRGGRPVRRRSRLACSPRRTPWPCRARLRSRLR